MFDEYFKTGKIPCVESVNANEVFYTPTYMNPQRCSYIKYGQCDVTRT